MVKKNQEKDWAALKSNLQHLIDYGVVRKMRARNMCHMKDCKVLVDANKSASNKMMVTLLINS